MALALQQGSIDSQNRRVRKVRYKVSYARQFFDLDLQKFVLEPVFIEIKQKELVGVSGAREELERRGLIEFRINNITITLRNKKNEWDIKNPNGRFKGDAVSRQGYLDHGMKMKVEKFHEFIDGTESTPIPIFEGFVADPIRMIPNKKQAQFIVASRHQKLKEANAEDVTILHDDVTLGVGDGIQTEFLLIDALAAPVLGVLRINRTTVADRVNRAGIDYSVSDLLDPLKQGKIIFTSAPSTGETVKATFIEGKKSERIEDLVEDLGLAGGLTIPEMVITPVTYKNRVINQNIVTSQADWEQAGHSRINLDSITALGAIQRLWYLLDDFSDNDFSSSPVWTIRLSAGTITAGGGELSVTAAAPTTNDSLIDTPLAGADVGSWDFKFRNTTVIGGGAPVFLLNGPHWHGTGATLRRGYYISVRPDTGRMLFTKLVVNTVTTLADLGPRSNGADIQWRVTRNSAGQWTFFNDTHNIGGGVVRQVAQVTDTSFTAFDQFALSAESTSDDTTTNVIDDIHFSHAVLNAKDGNDDSTDLLETDTVSEWESPVIDGTADFGQFLTLSISAVIPGGLTVTLETQSSDDGIVFPDGYVAVGGGGTILSTSRRFLQYRIRFTANLNDGTDFTSVEVNDATLVFTTFTTKIALANFLNQSIFAALNELAKIAAFEWGFTRAGILFFRPRSVSTTPVLTITRRDVVKDGFRNITNGVDRVFNRIVANYGNFDAIVDPFTRGDSSPHSVDKYGTHTLTISGGQILIDPDADIATGLALEYYDRFKDPRRVFALDLRMLSQLELGDTVRLRIEDETPERRWHIGDTSVGIGEPTIGIYGHEQQAAFDVIARVVAVENKKQSEGTTLELEEVL